MSDTEVNSKIDEKLLEHYKNAEHVSIIPLLKLIYITNGLDLSNDYKLKYSVSSEDSNKLSAGELVLSIPSEDNTTKKIKISLNIIDKDYDLLDSINKIGIFKDTIDTLKISEDESKDNETNPNNIVKLKQSLISAISFLTQACLVCFNMLKSNNKNLLEYNLMLAENTTIYLDSDLDKRIGVVFN